MPLSRSFVSCVFDSPAAVVSVDEPNVSPGLFTCINLERESTSDEATACKLECQRWIEMGFGKKLGNRMRSLRVCVQTHLNARLGVHKRSGAHASPALAR